MSSIFITSDTHFCHDKPFIYEPRGFPSVNEMNEAIIKNWNEVVSPEDTVYHLGDVMLGSDIEAGLNCLKRLNGHINIIIGNHDTINRVKHYKSLENVTVLGYATVIKYKKYNFYLSHYPTLTSNHDEDKPPSARVVNLCGHNHASSKWDDYDKGLIYHCELDAHNCYPITLDQIIKDIIL